MEADDIDAALGQEAGMVLQGFLVVFAVGEALGIVAAAPEADRLAVAAREVVAVLADGDEAVFAGDLFVEECEVEQGGGGEFIALGVEGPGRLGFVTDQSVEAASNVLIAPGRPGNFQ